MKLHHLRGLITLVLVLLLFISLIYTPTIGITKAEKPRAFNTFAKIHPLLLNESYWKYGGYVVDERYLLPKVDTLLKKLKIVNEESEKIARAIVVMPREVDALKILSGRVHGILSIMPTHIYKLAIVTITKSDLEKLASTPHIIAILPDVRIDALVGQEMARLKELSRESTPRILQTGSEGGLAPHYTVNVTRAIEVWTKYGVEGQGATIAIIDTGVDYASPGLGLDAIARDEYGIPLIFDADEIGLVFTPVEAVDLGNGSIYVNISQLYIYIPSAFTWYGEPLIIKYYGFVYVSRGDVWLEFWNDTWYIGNITHYGPIKFGMAFRIYATPIGTIYYTAPVIIVDSDGDGYYDTAYVDTTTTWYYVATALNMSNISVTVPPAPDYSFADEKPITFGNEIAALDINGDGYYDFSVGTLAGAVYDADYVILLELLGVIPELMSQVDVGYGYYIIPSRYVELWGREYIADYWPGIDLFYGGHWVVLAYDPHSHGTFCATTAAGRPFPAYVGYGSAYIVGQAPKAKIASAAALWLGDVLVSTYFFSGFSLGTPYGYGSEYLKPPSQRHPWTNYWTGYTWEWTYTGYHQVDLTSHSYGASAWALWGWASGMDPLSVVFDYTILVSGTLHFAAMGNGGPGWGTATPPGASALAVSVGAATEFTYRPLYGYLVGGNSQVVSWSNRGPNELGTVEPEVVAIGSFAWAVGRPWDSLAYNTLDARLAYDLFGGTSQATPMAAGVAALVVSAYKTRTGASRIPAYLVKTILMSTARDTGFNELSQGAGMVDAYEAVKTVMEGGLIAYSNVLLRSVMEDLLPTMKSYTYKEAIGDRVWYEPRIYIPHVVPGKTVSVSLTLEGQDKVRIYAVRLREVAKEPICKYIVGIATPDTVVGCSGDTLYVQLNNSYSYQLGIVVLDPKIFESADLVEISAVYPYKYFESGGRYGYWSQQLYYNGMELWYWIDLNNNGIITLDETARIQYDIRQANVFHVQIAKIDEQIREIEKLVKVFYGIDPSNLTKAFLLVYRVWRPYTTMVLPLKIVVYKYSYTKWTNVFVTPSVLNVKGKATVSVKVIPPRTPGFYSGYIVIESLTSDKKIRVPISFFVPLYLRSLRVLGVPTKEATFYKNYYLRGAFDYGWRYECGDWRVFKIYVPEKVAGIEVIVLWPKLSGEDEGYTSNLDVMVFGPWNYYMANESNFVKVFKVDGVQLAAELTASRYYFWDSIAPGISAIISPTPEPGFYRIVIRNIQFSGQSTEEPFVLWINAIRYYIVKPPFARAGGVYRMMIRFHSLHSLALPSGVSVFGDAIVKPLRKDILLYVEDISSYGIESKVKTYSSKLMYYVFVTLRISRNVYSGKHLLALSYWTNIPVIWYGYMYGGYPYVYYDQWFMPVEILIDVRGGQVYR